MLLQRKNDRRDATSRSFETIDPGGALGLRRSAEDAQQEIRIDQQPLERELNAGVEVSAVFPAVGVELHQRLRVGAGQRPPVGQAREPVEDPRRAVLLLALALRRADEDRAPARRVLRRPRHLERTADLHRPDRRVVHVDLIVRQHPSELARLRKPFRLEHRPHERRADHARTRGHRQTDQKTRITCDLHELFPLGRAGKSGLAVARITRCGGPSRCVAADAESLQQLPVHADVELLRPAHAHDVVLVLPPQPDLDLVLAVDREGVVRGDATPRSKRQVLALTIVLHDVQRNVERREAGRARRQSDGETRHLARRRQVPLHVRGGNRERIREVVEGSIRRLVARQQSRDVDVEAEQIANGVVVLGAIETMHGGGATRIGTRGPRAVKFGFELGGETIVGRRIRARHARRRHRTGAQLRHDFFPDLRTRRRICGIQRVERKARGEETLVVTGDAVLGEDRAVWRGGYCGWRLRDGLRLN